MDVHTPEQRSRNMAAIKGKNTKPELAVRRIVHRLGYRFALHRKDLPGNPDIVFPSRKKIIFVHGCYWHMHSCHLGQVVEKTNTEFWQGKRKATVVRDRVRVRALLSQGWDVLEVWACELKDPAILAGRLTDFLGD